ncbi:hypothetical protein [Flavobacterium difficile]|uniref:DUF3298 domain-containing protein n=1 Tax=Flavobacterium difficile TaxID=2709659 RepID=A0ABX0I5V6_9FLAO|nr:hypothetical protein [Flavobacterium difficile]NHM01475.1 hypothetical protein [Flavobacterium difficile]
MKKTLTLLLLVALTSVFAQTTPNTVDYKSNFNSEELEAIGKTIKDPIEKYEFYKHLYVVNEIERLRYIDENSELQLGELQKLPNSVLYDFVKKYLSEYTVVNEKPISVKDLDKKDEYEEFTLRDKINKVDKLFIEKDSTFTDSFNYLIYNSSGMCASYIEDFKRNIITIYGGCGTGASSHYTYVLFKNNEFIDLGNGYSKLTKSQFKKLTKAIKSIAKEYSSPADRSGAQFSQRPNGNFIITFRGFTEDDMGASGGSLEITYETTDLKTFIPTSVEVEKN